MHRALTASFAVLISLGFGLLLSGCYPKVGAAPGPLAAETVEVARAKWTDASPDALEVGRQAFLKSCDQCHGYPDVLAFPAEKWPAAAKRMGEKSKLDADQTENMTRFVLALRETLAKAPAPK
jgi:mono/diheme cytochrome c family protein